MSVRALWGRGIGHPPISRKANPQIGVFVDMTDRIQVRINDNGDIEVNQTITVDATLGEDILVEVDVNVDATLGADLLIDIPVTVDPDLVVTP